MHETSVVITTFNRPNELKIAVQSVLNQVLEPNEVIIVNDGDRNAVLEEFENHPLITVLHNDTPKGANYARNIGAQVAQYGIIMFLDDDDSWEPQKVKDQIDIFRLLPDVGLVYTGKLVVNSSNRTKVIYKIPADFKGDGMPYILSKNFIGTTSAVALKREVFFKAGGFDESFPAMQDYDLWVRICELADVCGDKKYNIRYTVHNRKGKVQISNSGINQLTAASLFLKKYANLFKKHDISIRKKKARFYFNVARSYRKKSLKSALIYSVKSFFTYPNIRAVAILFYKNV